MRRIIYAALVSLALSSAVGCLIPAYSGKRSQRTQQLIFQSENMRQLLLQWERFWFLDQPGHMNPQRVHGGVI